jgi:hypothetical protein
MGRQFGLSLVSGVQLAISMAASGTQRGHGRKESNKQTNKVREGSLIVSQI